MTLHYYSDTAVQTTLTSTISNSATSANVASTTGFPASFPFYLALDYGQTTLEVVEVTGLSALTVAIVRGVSGTTAQAHSAGAPVVHVAPAQFYNDTSMHTNSSAAVHGVTGAVVGTTDTQTLTNKTIASSANTINVTGGAIDTVIAGKQASNSNLTALAGTASGGLYVVTGIGSSATRAIVAGSSKVTVLNGNGGAGNPSVDVSIPDVGAGFKSPAPSVFTSSSTYAAPSPMPAYIKIRCVNGGGGAGGTAAISSQSVVSGAGAGGAFAQKTVATSGLTFPLQVNVGTGGGGGTGNAAGGAGGQSSVKDNNGAGSTLCTPGAQNANQGGGGGAATITPGAVGASGFNPSTTGAVGDFIIVGSPANLGVLYGATAATAAVGGLAGNGMGSGGFAGAGAGGAGNLYGGGAGGSAFSGTAGAGTGASGGNGIVIIEPIY